MHRCNRPVHLAPGRCKKQKATARRARASASRNGKHAEHRRLLLSGHSFALASRHSAVPQRCSLQRCCRPQVSRVASGDGPARAPSDHGVCRARPSLISFAPGHFQDRALGRPGHCLPWLRGTTKPGTLCHVMEDGLCNFDLFLAFEHCGEGQTVLANCSQVRLGQFGRTGTTLTTWARNKAVCVASKT